jgi:hypothetical protein
MGVCVECPQAAGAGMLRALNVNEHAQPAGA